MKVWMIKGSTGAYEDFQTWTVKTFLSETKAHAYCEQLNQFLKDHHLHYSNCHNTLITTNILNEFEELDHNGYVDCTGAEYNVESLDVEE